VPSGNEFLQGILFSKFRVGSYIRCYVYPFYSYETSFEMASSM
jgi:hypothetical protein